MKSSSQSQSKEEVARLGVSLPPQLLKELDEMVREKSYANRSAAIADMVRAALVEHQSQKGQGEIAGTITLVFDHHRHHLQAILTDLQHDHHECIVTTMHVHLDHDNCLEVIVVRGPAEEIKGMADALIAAKGVKHGCLTITTTGKDLPA